jgi:tripartite-type tricarboxylate transporter receptor subunit TctC
VTDKMSWADIPTCKQSGLDIDYLMLRGIFMPAGVTQEHVDYYIGLFAKVAATPEWKALMERGAFNQTKLKGGEYAAWVAKEEARHVSLMKAAGFIAK